MQNLSSADMEDISKAFNDAFAALEVEQENYWNSLTPEQQLMAFCAISRRIVKGEIVDKGSYRYVLYQIFGWGPEAYSAAQMAGYLTIHNSIMPEDHDEKLIEKFCEFIGHEFSEELFDRFLLKR